MALITVTVTSIDGVTPINSLQAMESTRIVEMTGAGNATSGAATILYRNEKGMPQGAQPKLQKWVVTETYAVVKAAIQAAEQEANAELTTNKDASGGYAGLTLLKINFLNVLGTFVSFFTNSNTAARTYTFQDRDGTIADDTDLALKAPLASPALTGTPTAPTATASANDTQVATTAFAQGRGKTPFGTSASAADTYVVVLAPEIAASAGSPLSGTRILLKCTNANTGAATLEVTGSTGAIAIVRRDGSTALSAADLPAGKYVPMFYDGTSWVCENVG